MNFKNEVILVMWIIVTFVSCRNTSNQSLSNYKSENITILTKDSVRLEGTLTLPLLNIKKGKVVILVSPSISKNREYFGSHIVDSLASHGIVALRFDNRGTGKSSESKKPVSLYTQADDVIEWLNYLKTRKDINSNKIGLMGHSEGCCSAQVVASQPGRVAFLVLLASPGIGGWTEHEYFVKKNWEIKELKNKTSYQDSLLNDINFQKPLFDILDRYDNTDSIVKHISYFVITWVYKEYGKLSYNEKIARFKYYVAPWVIMQQVALKKFQPQLYLSKIKCPVLALNGTLDYKLECNPNLKMIEESLKANGNNNVTTIALEGVDHSFHTTKLKNGLPYLSIPHEKFSQKALNIITEWILKQ